MYITKDRNTNKNIGILGFSYFRKKITNLGEWWWSGEGVNALARAMRNSTLGYSDGIPSAPACDAMPLQDLATSTRSIIERLGNAALSWCAMPSSSGGDVQRNAAPQAGQRSKPRLPCNATLLLRPSNRAEPRCRATRRREIGKCNARAAVVTPTLWIEGYWSWRGTVCLNVGQHLVTPCEQHPH